MTVDIELPIRPGTNWEHKQTQWGGLVCKNCGKGYNSHGAPTNHLACPASDEAWNEYNRKRAMQKAEDALAMFRSDLAQLMPADAERIVKQLYDDTFPPRKR